MQSTRSTSPETRPQDRRSPRRFALPSTVQLPQGPVCALAATRVSKQFSVRGRPEEKIPPGEKARVAREGEILVLGPERIQLVELFHPRQLPGRFEMIDNC